MTSCSRVRLSFLLGMIWFTSVFSLTWNNPYLDEKNQNVSYKSFSTSPKTLDPARVYSMDEIIFIANIYEAPLQYAYLKRPSSLEPLTAAKMPDISFYDKKDKLLSQNPDPQQVAYTVYDIYLKPGLYYQPHPAFAKDAKGQYLYHHLSPQVISSLHSLHDFAKTGSRELIADDYVYEIKRLASPKTNSPILGLMTKYILGLEDYAKRLEQVQNKSAEDFLDLRQYPLEGAKTIDAYHYQIKIQGFYPQFQYWLAMTFFSPIPWEADYFYSQPGMKKKNISFDWYPVGTGPYFLAENNPNKEMVLERNPNFHTEFYPSQGSAEDKTQGYLEDAGKKLPFIDKFIYSLEKEAIPHWNKFLQGYYDKFEITSDTFEKAIGVKPQGNPELTPYMQKKGIRLVTTAIPSLYYIGFNMLDDTVGGYTEKQQKLRQAIAMALDFEEYIFIFLNGRGIPANGPIPPDIFGYQKEIPTHKNLNAAKKLLAEAGYPKGIDSKTGKRVILNYDVSSSGTPDDKAHLNWMRKQFERLGVELNIRGTDFNHFQEKVRKGNTQLYAWSWYADYPDTENFLSLLYGPNGKVKYGGENTSNYANPRYDELFLQIKNLANGPSRQEKINETFALVQKDQPWVWGYYPIDYVLEQAWNRPAKIHPFANNSLKYERIDPVLRAKLGKQWNKALLWPFLLLAAIILLLVALLIITYWQAQNRPAVRRQ